MENFSSLTSAIKQKMHSPRNTLLNIPNLEFPLTIYKNSIILITKIARCLYLLNIPEPVYVSNAFYESFDFEKSIFNKIIFKKCYDSIYYDFDIEF